LSGTLTTLTVFSDFEIWSKYSVVSDSQQKKPRFNKL